jgi:hypothetical protein
VKAVVWFLNGTDLVDERLASSLALKRDARGAPLELSRDDTAMPGWLQRLQGLVGYRSALLRHLQLKLYDREVIRRVTSVGGGPEVVCASLRSAEEELRPRGIPVILVLLPLGPNIEKFPYMNLVSREEGSSAMEACGKESGATVIDLRQRLRLDPSLYWSSHRNMNPEGVRDLVAALAPELRGLLSTKNK